MSNTTMIFVLVIVAMIGYVIDGVLLLPVLRVALRESSIAATGIKALAILCAWFVVFLLALIVSHLAGWHPRHTYLLLALILAAHAWGLLFWYVRWERKTDGRNEE